MKTGMTRLLGFLLVATSVLGLIAADAQARSRRQSSGGYPTSKPAEPCKVLSVQVVDGTLVIEGLGLTAPGKTPAVALGGTPLSVDSAAPEKVVADVSAILAGLTEPKDFLLEIVLATGAACPSHLVTVVPPPAGNKLVFMTNGLFNGALTLADSNSYDMQALEAACGGKQGLLRADCICDFEAGQAGVTANFIAWLSDSSTDAIERFTTETVEGPWYTRAIDGDPTSLVLVSQTRADLVDYVANNDISLDNPIRWSLTAHTYFADHNVWTGTYADGTKDAHQNSALAHCNGWTDGTSGSTGFVGDREKVSRYWTFDDENDPEFTCNNSFPLYCFQR